jgi:hexosaminidase
LFPGKYIHIGGDECPKFRWTQCEKCQSRIKNENLKDEHELQSYFISRIEKFLNSKGKQIIGWDEILEGGLAPNAAVMSWRGTDGGIDAAKQKHFVVMSPGKPCYFDHYQSKDKKHEPLAIGGYNPLDSVYRYNPTPNVLTAEEKKFIMGAQGNVWTEYITDFSHVEYMSVPRMCALAEALWSPPAKKDYKNFIARLKIHSKLLDKMNVNYAKHFLKK